MSIAYCPPPPPAPLQMMAAPLVCGSEALTHAARVNAGLRLKSRTLGAGVPAFGMATRLAVAASPLHSSAQLIRPVTQHEERSEKQRRAPAFRLAEESAAVEDPRAWSNFQ